MLLPVSASAMSRSRESEVHFDDNPEKLRRIDSSPHPEPPISPPKSLVKKKPNFVSYQDIPDLPDKIKIICEILANSRASSVESSLNDAGVRVSSEEVEEVLKLSYGFPGPAVNFFRWAGGQLNDKHSTYAWNLVVDLLGKNELFDAMWDAVNSMDKEKLVSLSTFSSVFSSYVVSNRIKDALMTFEVIHQYGILPNVIALNSLLSAVCSDGQTAVAEEIFMRMKSRIRPDGDSYAILLEGWENEGNIVGAQRIFDTMLLQMGWNPNNVPAYDSFLCTLMKLPDGAHEAILLLKLMVSKQCIPGSRFFQTAFDVLERTCNVRGTILLWKEMVGNCGIVPDPKLNNAVITFLCRVSEYDIVLQFFDEMIYYGVLPGPQTYNILLQFALKRNNAIESAILFDELTKNEFLPTHANCDMAIKYFLDWGLCALAIKVWKYMLDNNITPLEDSGNSLLLGLLNNSWIPEAYKYANDMVNRGLQINSSVLSGLRRDLLRSGKDDKLEQLLIKLNPEGQS